MAKDRKSTSYNLCVDKDYLISAISRVIKKLIIFYPKSRPIVRNFTDFLIVQGKDDLTIRQMLLSGKQDKVVDYIKKKYSYVDVTQQ